MPCPLTTNILNKDCKDTAGVRRFYITPFSNLLTVTVVSNVVTAITKTVTWKKYEQETETASWEYSGASSLANGTSAYDWTANLKCFGLNTIDTAEFELLMKNKIVMIAEMENDDFWLLGNVYGCNVDTTKFSSGTAMGDHIGTMLTVKGRSRTSMLKVTPSIVPTLLV